MCKFIEKKSLYIFEEITMITITIQEDMISPLGGFIVIHTSMTQNDKKKGFAFWKDKTTIMFAVLEEEFKLAQLCVNI